MWNKWIDLTLKWEEWLTKYWVLHYTNFYWRIFIDICLLVIMFILVAIFYVVGQLLSV